jgi:alpha-L-rhamnosidase
MLGIERDESTPENVAYKHFKLNPIIGGELSFASGSYDSVYGIIASKWKVENGKTIYSFTVPANTSATLILPITDGQTVTESGSSIEDAVGVSVTKKASDSFTLEIQSGEYEFCVF